MKRDWITKLFLGLLVVQVVTFLLTFRYGDLMWSGVSAATILCWLVAIIRQLKAPDPERIKTRNRASLYYLITMDVNFGLGFIVERFGRRRIVDESIEGATFLVMTVLLALIFWIKQRQQRQYGNSPLIAD